MNTIACADLITSYTEWLRKKITIQDIGGACEITTPFLDRHNDHIQIYVKKDKDVLVLSDDGYTISDLRMSGFDFNSEKRKRILYTILNGFGVKLSQEELIVEAHIKNFPQKKHNLLQAILAINDLFVLAGSNVASLFKEDVEQYLRQNDVRFTPSIKLTGKSGYDHYLDFVIPASKKAPERVLKALNKPTRQNISSLIFSWSDIKDVRSSDSIAYGILNDVDSKINPDTLGALEAYGITPLYWSKKEDYIQKLAA
ncbi:MAG: DUF1828 domain-containing protein [Nitrospirae bacterium]|nr:DUF1828 domain-containing protein [Nitrospirota bacterium]